MSKCLNNQAIVTDDAEFIIFGYTRNPIRRGIFIGFPSQIRASLSLRLMSVVDGVVMMVVTVVNYKCTTLAAYTLPFIAGLGSVALIIRVEPFSFISELHPVSNFREKRMTNRCEKSRSRTVGLFIEPPGRRNQLRLDITKLSVLYRWRLDPISDFGVA